eukprot:3381674-Pyramimonas_sp.AAC.2
MVSYVRFHVSATHIHVSISPMKIVFTPTTRQSLHNKTPLAFSTLTPHTNLRTLVSAHWSSRQNSKLINKSAAIRHKSRSIYRDWNLRLTMTRQRRMSVVVTYNVKIGAFAGV